VTFSIDLSGSRALVTGGGHGVGRATCLALASAGAAVVVNDYVAERAEEVAEEVRDEGGEAESAPFDVTDFDAVMANASDRGIDVLVNNAGNAGVHGFNFGPFAESTPADWDRYFGVNLFGVMHCSRAVVPGMIERGAGRVITIISDAARWGEPGMAAYSAAKAGAAGFSRSLARDLGRHGITVNNIALGTIDTFGMSERERTPEEEERRKRQFRPYIIRRAGQPEEVAALVTFLAGPQAAWITGQTYPVNGGYTVNQ
jgi:3-oxoacyl-[acyl-carrier protein] reductase